MTFSCAMKEMKRVLKSHKLHSQLLTAAITSNPCHYETEFSASRNSRVARCNNNNGDDNTSKLNVTLERYIGDVFVAYFLMGHSVSGIVDGAPITAEKSWICKILKDIKYDETSPRNLRCRSSVVPSSDCLSSSLSSSHVSAGAWYRAWIFLHSTILRTAPFSKQQMLKLGIAPTNMDPAFISEISSGGDSTSLLTPSLPFMGTNKYKFMAQFSQHPHFVALRITSNDFGVLGPLYRGRDRVQTRVIQPMTAIGVIIAFDGLDVSSLILDMNNHHNSILGEWVTGMDPSIRWILDVHTEATKYRPVNVSPPLVTINCNS